MPPEEDIAASSVLDYSMTHVPEANLPGSLGDMTRAVLSPRTGGDILAQSGGSGRSDLILGVLVRGAALMVLLMLASLVVVLFYSAMRSIKTFGVKFLVTSVWRPNEREVQRRDVSGNIMRDADGEPIIDTIPAAFGAKAVIYGTVVSSIIALVVAVPLSFGASLFLVRIAPRWHLGGFLHVISFMIEFLAAIPSIAYGIWGLFVLAPFLQDHLEPMLNNFFGHVFFLRWMHTEEGLTGRDMLSAGLILGIMILPIITALSRDVLRAVPRTQIEGTLALGATWWQSCWGILRYGRSGLFGGVMLGLARAAGETMAVAMVIGNANRISSSLFASAQTMSSLLANEFAEANSDVQRSALVEVALILLLMSLLFNVVARYLIVGKQARMA